MYLLATISPECFQLNHAPLRAPGFQRAFPEVGPANVKGIELNPYAAEAGARVDSARNRTA